MKYICLFLAIVGINASVLGKEHFEFSSFTLSGTPASATLTGTNVDVRINKAAGVEPNWHSLYGEAMLYSGNTLVVTPKNGKTITRIAYTYKEYEGSGHAIPTIASVVGNDGEYSRWNGTTHNWTGIADGSVTLTLAGTAGHLGFSTLEISYEEDNDPGDPYGNANNIAMDHISLRTPAAPIIVTTTEATGHIDFRLQGADLSQYGGYTLILQGEGIGDHAIWYFSDYEVSDYITYDAQKQFVADVTLYYEFTEAGTDNMSFTALAYGTDGSTEYVLTIPLQVIYVADGPFSVIYNANEATSGSVPTDANEYRHGNNATVLGNTGNLARTGYKWIGWNTQSNAHGTHYDAGSSLTIDYDNVTLYAEWVTASSITLDANGHGTNGSAIGIKGEPIESFVGVTPDDGFTVDGYWTTADNSGVCVLSREGNTMMQASDYTTAEGNWNVRTVHVTLYAHYAKRYKGYMAFCERSIVFDKNGKEEAVISNWPENITGLKRGYVVPEAKSTAVRATNPSVTGAGFLGWYKEAEGINAWDWENDVVGRGNVTTLYAKWSQSRTELTVYANNGSSPQEYTMWPVDYGTAENFCYVPTKAGYELTGFFTAAEGGTELYDADGMMVMNVPDYTDATGWINTSSTLTLYAQWVGKELVVADGKNITISEDATYTKVTVEGGGTLAVTNGATLTVDELYLTGGLDGKGGYDVPRVYIALNASIIKTNPIVYLDLSINTDNWYPLAVPYPVKINGERGTVDNMLNYNVRYAPYGLNTYDGDLNAFAKYRTDGTGQVIIKTYDGAHRAETAVDHDNWAGVPYNGTLTPGVGYIIKAVTVGGKAVIRFEMNVPDAWTTNGEQATVGAVTKNTVHVIAHGKDDINLNQSHKGWNMLGVPYMSCFGSADWTNNEGLLTGIYAVRDGKLQIENQTVRYVTVPTYDFSEYIQTTVADAKLLPEWSFFVQVGTTGNLTFAANSQAQSPLRVSEESGEEELETAIVLSHGAKRDKTGLILHSDYSANYEIGADLEKMFGDGFTLSTYTVMNGTRLAFNAMDEATAAQTIPVGYRAPEAGEYTFSLDPRFGTEGIERIDLIDYETGVLTNLLYGDYTFTTGRMQTDTRFALNVTLRHKVPTGVDDTEGAGGRVVEKVVIDDIMYIIVDGKMYDATGKAVK